MLRTVQDQSLRAKTCRVHLGRTSWKGCELPQSTSPAVLGKGARALLASARIKYYGIVRRACSLAFKIMRIGDELGGHWVQQLLPLVLSPIPTHTLMGDKRQGERIEPPAPVVIVSPRSRCQPDRRFDGINHPRSTRLTWVAIQ